MTMRCDTGKTIRFTKQTLKTSSNQDLICVNKKEKLPSNHLRNTKTWIGTTPTTSISKLRMWQKLKSISKIGTNVKLLVNSKQQRRNQTGKLPVLTVISLTLRRSWSLSSLLLRTQSGSMNKTVLVLSLRGQAK